MILRVGAGRKLRKAHLNKALARAEALSRERGVRLTELRRRVLELVIGADHPVGAYDLLDKLNARTGAKAPMTVYRALDFLMEQRYIHKIESLNAFVACVDVDHPHDSQFMICTKCGAIEEIHDGTIAEALRGHSKQLGFQMQEQIVELRGLCAACLAKESTAAAPHNA